MRLAALAAAAVALGLAGASGADSKTGPCGSRAGTPTQVTHVIWIWFENRSQEEVQSDPSATHFRQLARECGSASQYSAVAHPSLPNYIAATSGGTQGITDDSDPAAHQLTAVSLFEQARSARSYEEGMPKPCDLTESYPYAPKHNPEAYYLRIRKRCNAGDVPLGSTDRGAFAAALKTSTLPAFSFVTPNLCDDMHDCPVATGDAWLGRWLPTITASRSYRAGHTVVFIVWDEDDGSADNVVPFFVVSPWTKPGTRSRTHFTHYSLLRTTEELLGLCTHLGHAASATSMRSAFGL